MAKIADVLQTERNRQAPTEWNKIHIFQMGDFYRAYEWSAWLIVAITYNDKVRKETKDRKPLKESKKSLATTGEEFCFVGFPIKSVEKFIPTRLNFESVEDKHIVITIELPTPSDGSKVTYERLHEAFSKWKAGIPLSTKEDTIDENGNKRPPKPKPANALPATTWADIRDFDFILWLTEQIVMLDPMAHCQIVGDLHDWDDIDHAKCMRFVEPGLALPIGNLTSQLFSNVYLNPFDQFVKRDILCRHYGRYVDDSTQIDPDRDWLLAQVPREREFLSDELGLQLHMGKLHIREVHQGVEFLGAFLKPYRDYVSRRTLERIREKLQQLDLSNAHQVTTTVNSYLGILSHSASYNLRREIFDTEDVAKIVEFDGDMLTCRAA